MSDKNKLAMELQQFHGTENYYRHGLSNVLYTDGIKYLADKANCYWIIDLIISFQLAPNIATQPFQVYRLTVKDSKAKITISNGNDKTLAIQDIEYTDFPLEEIRIWKVDNIILLPSEY